METFPHHRHSFTPSEWWSWGFNQGGGNYEPFSFRLFFTKKRSRIFPFQHANTLWHTSESTTEEICSGLRWRISRKNPRWCQFLRKETQQTWKKMFTQTRPSSAHRFVFLQLSNLMNFFFYCALKICSETKNSLFITCKWAQICVFWAELL